MFLLRIPNTTMSLQILHAHSLPQTLRWRTVYTEQTQQWMSWLLLLQRFLVDQRRVGQTANHLAAAAVIQIAYVFSLGTSTSPNSNRV